MKVKECTITEFFKAKNSFVVPPFQRRYAWKEKHFKMLWDDILTVVDGTKKRHFMGTVIFDPSGKGASFLVIDGQQRLATFTIILKILDEIAKDYGAQTRGAIRKLLVVGGHNRFLPSLPDREAFEFLITNPNLLKKGKEHRSVRACYEYFKAQIKNYIEHTNGQRPSKFSKISSAILEKMIFVELQLSGSDDAHSIFETINYAGVPLTSADLARNFVLGLAKKGESPEELNAKYWQPLEQRLEDNINGSNKRARKAELQRVLPEFIRAFLVVEKKKYITASDTFREFRTFFKNGNLEHTLKDLTSCSKIFCKFLNPELEPAKGVRPYLHNFVDIKMTTHYPVLIVLYKALEDGRIKSSELKSCMQYIESFVVRRAFKSKVSRDLNVVFARVAGKLADHNSSNQKYVGGFERLLAAEGWPTDDDFSACFVSSPIYTTAPAFARYSLISIEQKNSTAHREMLFDKTIQIEHVFPQQEKLADWVSSDLPSLKKNLHVMGNLTLTAYNAKLSNYAFEAKLNGYKKSPYWLTKKSIANKRRWTGKEVEGRSSLLLRQALRLWPGPK